MKNLQFVRYYSKPYDKLLIWGNVFSVLSLFFVMLLPQITQLFIDSVYTFSNTDTGNLGVFWQKFISLFGNLTTTQIVILLSTAFIICALLKNILNLFATQNFFKVSSDACGDVRKDCFKKLAFADKNFSTNETYFNFTNDISSLYNVYYKLFPQMITYPLLIVLASTLCFIINWKITLCFILFVPIMLLIGKHTNKRVEKLFNESRNRQSDMLKTNEELVHEIREIKAYGNEDWADEKYNKYNQAHSKAIKQSNNYLHICNLIVNMIKIVGIIICVTLATIDCFLGKLSIGYFILILSYTITIFATTGNLINNFYDWKISFIGISRLTKFLNKKTDIKTYNILKVENPNIKLKNVDLELNGKKIFNNLNFDFKFGNHYAILIKQGEGKTAFARMLLRFVGISAGKATFNNEPYENLNIASLRGQISYISQEPFIFEGTFPENIAMFENINLQRLEKVIEICELENLSKKYNNKIIVENGAKLQNQERQKINIARALYRDAPILVVDTAFNKFTSTFVQTLIQRIKKYYKNKTIIFLTDKKSEILSFKNRIEIENGTIRGEK